MELKQAIVIRTDLEMGKGKLCAQAAHASISAYKKVSPKLRDEWERSGMKKIVLKVNSESELFQYFQECQRAGIPCFLIQDAGLTQIASGSPTCFGAGPAEAEGMDKILGKLKLL